MQRAIQTTYRYRLDPTAEQEIMLGRFAAARRFVWNWALNCKREHFRETGKTLGLQQALRDLENVYQHFSRRVRNGEKNKGFPQVQVQENRHAALSYSATGHA